MGQKSRGFVLADTLRRGVCLTPSEVRVFETQFLQKQQDGSLPLGVTEYMGGIYRRLMKIEQGSSKLQPGHVILL